MKPKEYSIRVYNNKAFLKAVKKLKKGEESGL